MTHQRDLLCGIPYSLWAERFESGEALVAAVEAESDRLWMLKPGMNSGYNIECMTSIFCRTRIKVSCDGGWHLVVPNTYQWPHCKQCDSRVSVPLRSQRFRVVISEGCQAECLSLEAKAYISPTQLYCVDTRGSNSGAVISLPRSLVREHDPSLCQEACVLEPVASPCGRRSAYVSLSNTLFAIGETAEEGEFGLFRLDTDPWRWECLERYRKEDGIRVGGVERERERGAVPPGWGKVWRDGGFNRYIVFGCEEQLYVIGNEPLSSDDRGAFTEIWRYTPSTTSLGVDEREGEREGQGVCGEWTLLPTPKRMDSCLHMAADCGVGLSAVTDSSLYLVMEESLYSYTPGARGGEGEGEGEGEKWQEHGPFPLINEGRIRGWSTAALSVGNGEAYMSVLMLGVLEEDRG
ncbi:hypothetical protein KIPB_006807 [Kipferlia bialata]|uniref:Uncharacterized protein n=1 Tax=Kipferlia bialata TaxID=797122 RepID=A0A9K3CZ30_9EUKA|nr:hypothetical protein KIPB_006807 [Kipferlia bialata]|eukprot:g6807.t1